MKRIITISVIILGVAAWTPRARAQGQQEQHSMPLSQVVRLNRAPVSKSVLEVQLPRPRQTKLANGLTVLVLERTKLPTVDFILWVKSGALEDPKDLPGLAHFTADMLKEGTTHRTSEQLAADVDDIGASLDASAAFGASTSTVSASGLSPDTARLLELMSDMVLNPTFPQTELDKYKQRELAQLVEERASPGFLGQERLYKVLYRDFPAAEVSATPESVKAVTADELKKFHDDYYAPDNSILAVAGDVTYDQVVPLIEKYFGAWKPRAVPKPDLGALPPPAAAKVVLVDRPDSVQTNILAGDYALRRDDPNYIPLVVTNRILGGGPAARLFLDLREEKGLTYGAYSFFGSDIYPRPWVASTQVRTAVTDQAMQALVDNFKKMRDVPVPEAELDDARHSIVASFALSLEQPSTLLGDWLTSAYYNLPENYWDRYPAEVAKVTPEVVQQTARKYIDLAHLQFVCVGDGKAAGNADKMSVEDILKKYGPLEVYNADGKRLE